MDYKRKLKIVKTKKGREDKFKKKKLLNDFFDKKYDEYKSLDSDDILKLSHKIVLILTDNEKLIKENADENIETITELKEGINEILSLEEILEIRLEVLKKIIDEQIQEPNGDLGFEYSNDFSYYPVYDDIDFNEKIAKKKEFLINKIPPIEVDVDMNDLSNKLCDSTNFKLSESQKFIKTFLSPKTPYNSVLLFYGTGVGKTCSAISIAEQYIEELSYSDKKIYILLNPSIKESFRKNIFNIERLRRGIPEVQCTGTKYLNEIGYHEDMPLQEVEKKIKRLIDTRYKFMGYQEFANFIEKIENKFVRGIRKDLIKKHIDKTLKQIFSNSVLIIDEAHNIKQGDKKEGGKVLPPILERIIKLAENMKLILLTATPMFDNSLEILWLVNLLLMNDNRPLINASDVFDKLGNITKKGEKILTYKTRGYISYLRGENPIKFPLRLYPDIYNHPNILTEFPSNIPESLSHNSDEIEIKEVIDEKDKISYLKILGYPMRDQHLNDYINMSSKSTGSFGAFDSGGLQISNVVYPGSDRDPKKKIGSIGLNKVFTKKTTNKHFKFTLKNDENKEFLDIKNIGNYSSKIEGILNNIEHTEGVVFIYTQFIASGVIPLALALEYNGYTFLSENKEIELLNSNIEGSRQVLNKKPKKTFNGINKRFIIISGEKGLSKNSYKNYIENIESKNKDGSQVKIIIGSETAAEGLDFSYIREVHILDPWHHTNKTEQVIGRAIRFCSHINLEPQKRNVIVYLYASILGDDLDDFETIDIKTYRRAENKSKQMAEIEYILKTNSVDCNINIEGNKFLGDFWEKELETELPRNNLEEPLVSILIKDDDYSKKCNFKKCNYKCSPDLSKGIDHINDNTFDPNNLNSNINELITTIKEIFLQEFIFDLAEINQIINEKITTDNILIYKALEKMINQQIKIYDMYNREGILVYKGGFYMFQPSITKKITGSYINRIKPLTKKIKKIKITPYINTISLDNTIINNSNITDVYQILKQYDKELKNIINNEVKILEQDRQLLIKSMNEITKYRYSTDWIISKDKEILLQHLITKISKEGLEKLSPLETELYGQLNYNILYMNRDIKHGQSKFKDNETIWGYKLAIPNSNKDSLIIQYYRFKLANYSFTIANALQMTDINLSNQRKKEKMLDSNVIIGYMEEKLPEQKMVLKIRDKTKEGAKGTEKKRGSICGNDGMKKQKIIEFIGTVLGIKKYSTISKRTQLPGKQFLCKELEIYLRLRDLQESESKQQRWFYNVEETVEYKLSDIK